MANAAAVSQPPKSAAPASPPAPPAPELDAPEADSEPVPTVETVNMAGLVLERTVHSDGECETKVLKEPMIADELVRATRASQRRYGR
jgi:hypothetical protein